MRTVDCPACGAHFALPEDLYERKVQGRKATVRCKVCGERVRLDGTTRAGVEDLWVVSVGDDERELSTSQVSDALKSGEIDSSAIVWKEGMADWVTVDRVEHFAPALAERTRASETVDHSDPPSPADLPSDDSAGVPDESPTADAGSSEAVASAAESESAAAPEPAAESASPVSDAAAASPVPVLFESAPEPASPASDAAASPRVPVLFESEPEPESPASEPDAGVASEVETAPAAPVAARAVRNKELHALFAVESMPPDPVDLDDSDMQSLPPSDVPALTALRARLVVPKAPRAPARDLIGQAAEDAVVLAPPSASALMQVIRDPVEPESPAADVDIPVDEDVDIPIDEEVTVPETLAAKRAQVAAPEPPRRGRVLLVMGAGLAAIVGLIGIGLWHRTDAPEPARAEPSIEAPAAVPSARGLVAASASPDTESPDQPASAMPVADSPLGPGARANRAPKSDRAQPKSVVSPDPDPDRAASAPSPRESKPKQPSDTKEASSGTTFDKGAAIAALTAAAAAASSCRRGADPSGTATVLVTFAPSGRVTSANLTGPPFAGTATGGCIAAQMRMARVPRFSGGHVTVSKRVVIH